MDKQYLHEARTFLKHEMEKRRTYFKLRGLLLFKSRQDLHWKVILSCNENDDQNAYGCGRNCIRRKEPR